MGLMADAKTILLIEGGRGGRLETLIDLDSIGFVRTHLDMLGLAWTNQGSDGFIRTHLDLLGLTRIHCDSLDLA